MTGSMMVVAPVTSVSMAVAATGVIAGMIATMIAGQVDHLRKLVRTVPARCEAAQTPAFRRAMIA